MTSPHHFPSFVEARSVRVVRRQHSLRWLHAGGHLLLQGRAQSAVIRWGLGVASRRAIQRQQLAQRLLEQDVTGWLMPMNSGSRFWTGLRWGGAGFALAWWLKS